MDSPTGFSNRVYLWSCYTFKSKKTHTFYNTNYNESRSKHWFCLPRFFVCGAIHHFLYWKYSEYLHFLFSTHFLKNQLTSFNVTSNYQSIHFHPLSLPEPPTVVTFTDTIRKNRIFGDWWKPMTIRLNLEIGIGYRCHRVADANFAVGDQKCIWSTTDANDAYRWIADCSWCDQC